MPKTYSVPTKPEETTHGVLGCPEAMMGTTPIYVYRSWTGFYSSLFSPEENKVKYPNDEYIVTIYPRDAKHWEERMAEIIAWHTS